MSHVNAWILDFGMGYKAAVGARELIHLIDVPVSFSVPYTPEFCHRVLFWQGMMLPLMDVAARLGGDGQDSPFVAVVGYQQQRGELPQFGAVQLAAPPAKVAVSDEQACNLPPDLSVWQGLVVSCFDFQGQVTPVVNINRLFSAS